MSLLHKKVLTRLDGKYEAVVKSYREVENAQGGYIELILNLLPNDREFKYNIFPNQIDYVTHGLNNQLGLADSDEDELATTLENLGDNKFDIWISYNTDYGRYNTSLYPPKPVVVNEEAVEL